MDNWFSLTNDLLPKEHKEPFEDKNIFIWVHQICKGQYDSYTTLYDYKIFSNTLNPILLKEGDFTCTVLSEFCGSRGCGNFYGLKYGITDKNNNLEMNYTIAQIEGVIDMIKFLRQLSKFKDWDEYNNSIIED